MHNIAGIVGVLLVNSASLPAIYIHLVKGGSLPPLIMLLPIFAGLLLLQSKAIFDRTPFYIASNCVGIVITGTAIMLGLLQ